MANHLLATLIATLISANTHHRKGLVIVNKLLKIIQFFFVAASIGTLESGRPNLP